MFTDAVGRPLRPEAVSREFGKARDRLGVPRVRFHDLRHSAATTLLAAGVPLAVITEWLGHAGDRDHGELRTPPSSRSC